MVVVRLGVGDTGLGESDALATLGCSTGVSTGLFARDLLPPHVTSTNSYICL